MIKKILTILVVIFISSNMVTAHDCDKKNIPNKPTFKEQRQFDKFLNEQLNLTETQQDQLKKNRSKYRREMEKIVNEMQKLHDDIRDVYLTGIPKFQADLKTAPIKAQLVSLKQSADKLRAEHRKSFENALTPEQKIKFEEIKKEKRPK